jgi:hypothetical protein
MSSSSLFFKNFELVSLFHNRATALFNFLPHGNGKDIADGSQRHRVWGFFLLWYK